MAEDSKGLHSLVQRLIGKLNQQDADTDKIAAIRMLRGRQRYQVEQALEMMRVRGWLRSGELCNIDLSGVNLSNRSLSEARLSGSSFHEALLDGANLARADLFGADMRLANLTGADLQWTDLRQCSFQGAFLMETDLRSALLDGADLTGARLGMADLRGASVLAEQLATAAMLHSAIMPDGSRYDGRFNLPGDQELARFLEIDGASSRAMAEYYGVTVQEFVNGQRTAVAYGLANLNFTG